MAIGTDSVASNNNLNMIKEMFLCALLPKGLHNDASVVSERDILKMATVNGYKAQGREDSGAIKAGYKADLCVLNIESEHMYPQTDMINNLVYAADGADGDGDKKHDQRAGIHAVAHHERGAHAGEGQRRADGDVNAADQQDAHHTERNGDGRGVVF